MTTINISDEDAIQMINYQYFLDLYRPQEFDKRHSFGTVIDTMYDRVEIPKVIIGECDFSPRKSQIKNASGYDFLEIDKLLHNEFSKSNDFEFQRRLSKYDMPYFMIKHTKNPYFHISVFKEGWDDGGLFHISKYIGGMVDCSLFLKVDRFGSIQNLPNAEYCVKINNQLFQSNRPRCNGFIENDYVGMYDLLYEFQITLNRIYGVKDRPILTGKKIDKLIYNMTNHKFQPYFCGYETTHGCDIRSELFTQLMYGFAIAIQYAYILNFYYSEKKYYPRSDDLVENLISTMKDYIYKINVRADAYIETSQKQMYFTRNHMENFESKIESLVKNMGIKQDKENELREESLNYLHNLEFTIKERLRIANDAIDAIDYIQKENINWDIFRYGG